MNGKKIIELILLIIAGGAIYPVVYLRQNFQSEILQVFNITNSQLGDLYSVLGIAFFLGYAPGGWLADRISAKALVTFSLISTGLLGLYYSTVPNYNHLYLIYIGWGITTGLTFSSASIKLVNIIAGATAQGRFFGAFDGGKGLIEAILATVAVYIYFHTTGGTESHQAQALINVILMYSITMIVIGIIFWLVFRSDKKVENLSDKYQGNLFRDLKTIFSNKKFWLVVLIIFSGYQVFWATYSFSGYLNESDFGLTPSFVGAIIALKLWTRPIGGIGAGFIADRFCIIKTLLYIMLLLFILNIFTLIFPLFCSQTYLIVFLVVCFGLITYSARGVYWSPMELCGFDKHILGLAIGVASLLSYSPDILLPIFNGYLLDKYPGVLGYQLYFSYMAIVSFVGIIACVIFRKIIKEK
ncbi:MFS transporter [Francisella tularensis subsp. novicida]|uniref:MFS transporter n=1 Tax=Francisella tularensis TaxID=263 RepID=UPI000CE29D22|nr:MFS transporter [Francisella tularensis]AVC44756.1 MFS transporter [Francisella tularensis subsp. novicida]